MDAKKKPKKYTITISTLFNRILNMTEEERLYLLKNLDRWLTMEKRDIPRKPCQIDVNYSIGGRSFYSFIQDINSQGVFIGTGHPHDIGSKIIMNFSLSGFETPLRLEGRIRRKTPEGVGVSFSSLTMYQTEMIQAVVDRMKEAN